MPVPGLGLDEGAVSLEALRRPGAAEPAKAGDAVVAPKQDGAQGFYKVWVSGAMMPRRQSAAKLQHENMV